MERRAFLLSHDCGERQCGEIMLLSSFTQCTSELLTMGEVPCQAERVSLCSERGRTEERVKAGCRTSSFCSLPVSGPFLDVQDDSKYISKVNQQGLGGE